MKDCENIPIVFLFLFLFTSEGKPKNEKMLSWVQGKNDEKSKKWSTGHGDHPVASAQDPSKHSGADSSLSVPGLGDTSV